MRRKRAIIHIYDPNMRNPYGCELSLLLNKHGYSVILYQPSDSLHDAPRPLVRSVTLGQYGGDLRSRASARILAPLRVLVSVRRGDVVIVVWTRDVWDSLVFVFLTILCRTILIDHNPISVRAVARWRQRALNLFRRVVSVRAVHTQWMSVIGSKTVVLPHPVYSAYEVEYEQKRGVSKTIGFIGTPRDDKGGEDIFKAFQLLDDDTQLHLIGGDVPVGMIIANPAVLDRIRVVGQALSEQDFSDAIRSVSVVLLPYTEPTFSAALMAAFSAGVPALAYRHASMGELLTESSQSGTTPDELSALTASFLLEPWDTYRFSRAAWDSTVVSSWIALLGNLGVYQS
jgi:glycosyltransferase involved in cell wall biosynthesis